VPAGQLAWSQSCIPAGMGVHSINRPKPPSSAILEACATGGIAVRVLQADEGLNDIKQVIQLGRVTVPGVLARLLEDLAAQRRLPDRGLGAPG
jgi:hypothetical protein